MAVRRRCWSAQRRSCLAGAWLAKILIRNDAAGRRVGPGDNGRMIEQSTFYREVRRFSLTVPSWEDAIRYFTKPDERWDVTLVSQRVYGNRDDYLAVMAAAGLDRLDEELTERLLVLPTPERLALIKQQTGYSSTAPRKVR